MDVSPDSLLGTWRLRRRLVDRRESRHGSMSGTLTLARSGEQLHWDEAGVLQWAGQEFAATRRYLLVPSADGWWVHFADGRPFHPWAPGAVVEHPCAADLYRGMVRVGPRDRWRVLWDVTGPRKDQRIVTRLSDRG